MPMSEIPVDRTCQMRKTDVGRETQRTERQREKLSTEDSHTVTRHQENTPAKPVGKKWIS